MGVEVPYFLMRRDLREAIAEPVWPEGLSLAVFSESRAAEAHALLQLAYADGGGAVPPFGEWWPRLSADSEYDPAFCFLLEDSGGRAAGFKTMLVMTGVSAALDPAALHPQPDYLMPDFVWD